MRRLLARTATRWLRDEVSQSSANLQTADVSLEATRRELAIFAADMVGAQSFLRQFDNRLGVRDERRLFRDLFETSALPYMVLDPRPGLHIVDVNDAYAAATLTARAKAAGGKLFDVFPDNPDDPDASGVANLFESLQFAAQRSAEHVMNVQRYDVRDECGHFVQRHWQPVNTPLFDDAGRLVYLLHHVVEVEPVGLEAPDQSVVAFRPKVPSMTAGAMARR